MSTSQVREGPSVDKRAKTCTPCGGGIPPLTPQEELDLRAQIPEWELCEQSRRIERRRRFRDFGEALSFAARVGEVAEPEGHHPDIRFAWGYATVSLQTKEINGLHDDDFIVAAKIDHVLKEADE